MAQSLRTNHALQVLELDRNYITNRGMLPLAEALKVRMCANIHTACVRACVCLCACIFLGVKIYTRTQGCELCVVWK